MLELHELLGRDIDPVDDVRYKFEDFYTEDYRNPLNGDWISDDYYRIIDLTTAPGRLSDDEIGKLERSIIRLNEKPGQIQRLLGSTSLLDTYNEVARQVSDINLADPNRAGIPMMQFAPVKVEASTSTTV